MCCKGTKLTVQHQTVDSFAVPSPILLLGADHIPAEEEDAV